MAVVSHAHPIPLDLESGVRVACDVGYLCANLGLPRPLRQTDVGQHRSLMLSDDESVIV